MHRYQAPPPRRNGRRWEHTYRIPYSHNLEVDPGVAASVHQLAEHFGVTKKEMVGLVLRDYLEQRPIHAALVNHALEERRNAKR